VSVPTSADWYGMRHMFHTTKQGRSSTQLRHRNVSVRVTTIRCKDPRPVRTTRCDGDSTRSPARCVAGRWDEPPSLLLRPFRPKLFLSFPFLSFKRYPLCQLTRFSFVLFRARSSLYTQFLTLMNAFGFQRVSLSSNVSSLNGSIHLRMLLLHYVLLD
jgi:hypothetical protein